MLHRLRSVLVRPGRDRLTGLVEVDETFIGGEESGLRGGRAQGQEGAHRHRGGGPGTDGARPVPDAAVGRCVGRLAARVRDRSFRNMAQAMPAVHPPNLTAHRGIAE